MHQREHVAHSVSRLPSCVACRMISLPFFARLAAETTEELVFPDCFKLLSGGKQQESQVSCCFSPVLALTAFRNSV